jgi:predicted MPP superfamily phosphohydrolase
VGKNGLSRRHFLRNSLAAIAGAAVPIAGYSQFIEPHRLTIERLQFQISNLPSAFDGFRIVQLSDFHYGDYVGDADVSPAVSAANSLQPDLVALTGDFITSPAANRNAPPSDPAYSYMVSCAKLLAALQSRDGIVACMGNHDSYFNERYVDEVLAANGIKLLKNENLAIEREGKRLWVAAIDDVLFGKPDFGATMKGIPVGEPVVLLAHEPDVADETAKHPIALQLSGHSHGGQIRLPVLGCPMLPELARKYPYGYYRVGNVHVYTNRGIGTILLPYRFNAPPEVTLITLRSTPKKNSQNVA